MLVVLWSARGASGEGAWPSAWPLRSTTAWSSLPIARQRCLVEAPTARK